MRREGIRFGKTGPSRARVLAGGQDLEESGLLEQPVVCSVNGLLVVGCSVKKGDIPIRSQSIN